MNDRINRTEEMTEKPSEKKKTTRNYEYDIHERVILAIILILIIYILVIIEIIIII
jgi:hypothetical protein